jgi:hypothetical protein
LSSAFVTQDFQVGDRVVFVRVVVGSVQRDAMVDVGVSGVYYTVLRNKKAIMHPASQILIPDDDDDDVDGNRHSELVIGCVINAPRVVNVSDEDGGGPMYGLNVGDSYVELMVELEDSE